MSPFVSQQTSPRASGHDGQGSLPLQVATAEVPSVRLSRSLIAQRLNSVLVVSNISSLFDSHLRLAVAVELTLADVVMVKLLLPVLLPELLVISSVMRSLRHVSTHFTSIAKGGGWRCPTRDTSRHVCCPRRRYGTRRSWMVPRKKKEPLFHLRLWSSVDESILDVLVSYHVASPHCCTLGRYARHESRDSRLTQLTTHDSRLTSHGRSSSSYRHVVVLSSYL